MELASMTSAMQRFISLNNLRSRRERRKLQRLMATKLPHSSNFTNTSTTTDSTFINNKNNINNNNTTTINNNNNNNNNNNRSQSTADSFLSSQLPLSLKTQSPPQSRRCFTDDDDEMKKRRRKMLGEDDDDDDDDDNDDFDYDENDQLDLAIRKPFTTNTQTHPLSTTTTTTSTTTSTTTTTTTTTTKTTSSPTKPTSAQQLASLVSSFFSSYVAQLSHPLLGSHSESVEVLSLGVRRWCKGFGIGYAMKTLLSFVSLIIRVRANFLKIRLFQLRKVFFGESVWYGASLATFLCVFETIMRLFRLHPDFVLPLPLSLLRLLRLSSLRVVSPDTLSSSHDTPTASSTTTTTTATITLSKDKRAFIAGLVAGTSLWLLPSSSRSSIMLFFLVRALEHVCRFISTYYPTQLTRVIPTFVQENADVLLMSVASAQVCFSGFHARPALDPSYRSFLDHHSQRPLPSIHAYIHANGGTVIPDPSLPSLHDVLHKLNALRDKANLPRVNFEEFGLSACSSSSCSSAATTTTAAASSLARNPHLQCLILHGGESCTHSFFAYLVRGFRGAIPVYVPIYTIPLVLFRLRSALHRPLTTLLYTTTNCVRSCFFLAMYCTFGMHVLCASRWLHGGRASMIHSILAGVVAGICVAIEKKERRIELALYVFSHALLSSYHTLKQQGWLRPLPQADVLLYALSMSVLMHGYVGHAEVMRGSYASMFRFLFGSGAQKEGIFQLQHEHHHAKPQQQVAPLKSSLAAVAEVTEDASHQQTNGNGVFTH